MTGGLIDMDDAFIAHLVYSGSADFISSLRGFFIAFFNGVDYVFNGSTHIAALSGIVSATFVGLTGTFTSLRRIGQGCSPILNTVFLKKEAHYPVWWPICQVMLLMW